MELNKNDVLKLFAEIALKLGVPPEKGAAAAKACFESMARMAEKVAKQTDRDRRKCRLEVFPRPAPDVALVEWLRSLPASMRDGAITNNVRPYVPLYENDLTDQEPDVVFGETENTRQDLPLESEVSSSFKMWFGDSKVVDAKGRPLVVYHDTKNTPGNQIPDAGIDKFRTPTWFKASPDAYFAHATAPDGEQQYPAYLSLQNPLITTNYDLASEGVYDGWKELQGHDGVILKSESGDVLHVVAFNPSQIKFAIGNYVAFDVSNPDIRVGRTGEVVPADVLLATAASKQVLNVVCEGAYSGRLLNISDGLVTQKINRAGDTVQHDAAKLSLAVKVEDVVYIKYVSGVGVVSGLEKGVEIGR